jgi:hypothetical protein
MSISGSLEDVSVADVMQFIHLGRRTGTLVLEREGEIARIGFHGGKLVSAFVPGRPKLGTLLVESGLLDRDVLEDAIDLQSHEETPRSLGQILVANGEVDPEKLREVIVHQIETTVSEAVSWHSGTFEFVVDDLRPVDDVALYPGDLVPNADVNTQMVLLEAARIFDEKNREGGGVAIPVGGGDLSNEDTHPMGIPQAGRLSRGSELPPAAAKKVSRAAALTLLEPEFLEGVVEEADEEHREHQIGRLWVDIVSGDETLARRLANALPERSLHVARADLHDAAVGAPVDSVAVAVLDLRHDEISMDEIRAFHQSRPRVAIVALVEQGASFAGAYAAGAKVVLPPEVEGVVAIIENLVDEYPEPDFGGADGRGGVARLRRVFGDLRSGLISATVALNLMHIISESVERAVLFLVKRDALMSLGAFGTGVTDRPLAELTRGFTINLEDDNALTWGLDQGEAHTYTFDEARLPEDFVELAGRPRNGQVVIFPVLGAQRVISIIYADNGDREELIEDIDILELATAQVGMAFENELLRRQISQADEI